MFINKLGLKNFKCFKEVEVDFSKITLLTGENSSGKSSLIYGLLAPFQSEDFPLYLFPNGKYVNMGDFEEISFKNLKNNKIGINININIMENFPFNLDTTWILDPTNKLPKLYQLKAKFFVYLSTLKMLDPNFNLPTDDGDYSNLDIKLNDDYSSNNYQCSLFYENKENINSFKDKEIDVFSLLSSEKYKDNEESISHILLKDYITLCIGIINQRRMRLNLLGSYRLYPERTYYQKTKSSNRVLPSGDGFIDQILEWQEKGNKQFDDLITILKDLKLLYDIKPHKIGGGRFDFRVKVKKSSNWASLADVGFGVSQLLPIIVADLQLDDNSTLIMAQPETHLHPSIQAELGTYLVKQINQLEKQYIIETHSEYLINRLRLSIVKGEIEPEDVAVYYFENTAKEGSIAHRIEFTKQGQILNAPQGFFDTYMMDTMNIALNA